MPTGGKLHTAIRRKYQFAHSFSISYFSKTIEELTVTEDAESTESAEGTETVLDTESVSESTEE